MANARSQNSYNLQIGASRRPKPCKPRVNKIHDVYANHVGTRIDDEKDKNDEVKEKMLRGQKVDRCCANHVEKEKDLYFMVFLLLS